MGVIVFWGQFHSLAGKQQGKVGLGILTQTHAKIAKHMFVRRRNAFLGVRQLLKGKQGGLAFTRAALPVITCTESGSLPLALGISSGVKPGLAAGDSAVLRVGSPGAAFWGWGATALASKWLKSGVTTGIAKMLGSALNSRVKDLALMRSTSATGWNAALSSCTANAPSGSSQTKKCVLLRLAVQSAEKEKTPENFERRMCKMYIICVE